MAGAEVIPALRDAVGQVPASLAYEQHRSYVLAVLGRRCGWLDQDEREAVFHDAYVVFLQKQAEGTLGAEAMHPRQVRAYLVQTAIHKALDQGKRAERRRTEPIGEHAMEAPDAGPGLEELVSASLESARLREIVAELPERRQAVVKLRFFFDRTPEEIQGLLGLTERVYRRELERAMRQIAERYELVRDGRFCESRRSVILAYVAGIAGPNRARAAAEHLATCPGCARWAADLREGTKRAAALLPAPVILEPSGGLDRLLQGGEAVRQSAVDLLAGAKQHAVGALLRLDPSTGGYALGARPGAAAAAIVGCLAIGGGATYCVVEGVPGIPERKPEPKSQQVRSQKRAETPPRTTSSPRPLPPGSATRTAATKRPKVARRSQPASAAPAREFGFESGPAVVPRPRPRPQPQGEFDP